MTAQVIPHITNLLVAKNTHLHEGATDFFIPLCSSRGLATFEPSSSP